MWNCQRFRIRNGNIHVYVRLCVSQWVRSQIVHWWHGTRLWYLQCISNATGDTSLCQGIVTNIWWACNPNLIKSLLLYSQLGILLSQLGCWNICKIVTWSAHYILRNSKKKSQDMITSWSLCEMGLMKSNECNQIWEWWKFKDLWDNEGIMKLSLVWWLGAKLSFLQVHVHDCARHIDGLVQDCSISIAWSMEILQSCTKPSIW